MSTKKIYVGDSFAVGPFYARKTDGSVLPMTGALIESACKLVTGGAEVFRRENTAAGGDDSEISITDAATGEFYVYVSSTESSLLEGGKTYRLDARVKTTEAIPTVATVGYVEFETEAAITPIPA